MKHYSFPSLVIAMFCLFIPLLLQGQKPGFAINPKAGIYTAKDEKGGAVGVEFNYMKNGWIFSGDFFHFQEIRLLAPDNELFRQFGLMAGKYYGDRYFRVQLQGGIASLWETGYRESTEPERVSTVGLVLKTGLKYMPLHFMSIGLDLQGNINPEKPLVIPFLSIEFGRLRDKINK
jgi:hypothetical protein